MVSKWLFAAILIVIIIVAVGAVFILIINPSADNLENQTEDNTSAPSMEDVKTEDGKIKTGKKDYNIACNSSSDCVAVNIEFEEAMLTMCVNKESANTQTSSDNCFCEEGSCIIEDAELLNNLAKIYQEYEALNKSRF